MWFHKWFSLVFGKIFVNILFFTTSELFNDLVPLLVRDLILAAAMEFVYFLCFLAFPGLPH